MVTEPPSVTAKDLVVFFTFTSSLQPPKQLQYTVQYMQAVT
jgi:hypothetical protein